MVSAIVGEGSPSLFFPVGDGYGYGYGYGDGYGDGDGYGYGSGCGYGTVDTLARGRS